MTVSNPIRGQDGWVLAGRVLLALLFLIFGLQKLFTYGSTVQYMAHVGAPLPDVAAVIAIVMETLAPAAIMLGIATRPIALLLALYTLGTALLGHHYWTLTGMPRYENEINFYKNLSIIGGCLLLYVTGAGRYALDHLRRHGRGGDRATRMS